MEDIEDLNQSTRIAVIDSDRCKPNKCGQPCIKSCPVIRQGKICIEITKPVEPSDQKAIAQIAETLCTGCGICVKVCPYKAIKIVRVPRNLETNVTHRFGPNTFKLHGFPELKTGTVHGIIGQNGLGKSTILSILSHQFSMNLGKFDQPPNQKQILNKFRGSSMQNFFKNPPIAAIKPQHLREVLNEPDDLTTMQYILRNLNFKEDENSLTNLIRDFNLENLVDRPVKQLSGGETQRLLCGITCHQDAHLYLFDEPTSYLDLKQRLQVSNQIRSTCNENSYTVVVDHDLSILDYLSDFVIALYGKPGVYGVTSVVYPVAVGINAYLEGYLPKENMRFRRTPYTFERVEPDDNQYLTSDFSYPQIEYAIGDFRLTIQAGQVNRPGIIVLMGENGTGKTTFANLLSQQQAEDHSISYKKQNLSTEVRQHPKQKVKDTIGNRVYDSSFVLEIIKPLNLEHLLDRSLRNLSGGELQKVLIAATLAKNVDIYLLDEPSAYLDLETRVNLARILKRYFINHNKLAFIIDHDIVFSTYLADQLIIFEGTPGLATIATPPIPVPEGMNRYLKNLNITIRSDGKTHRRRINKLDSNKDREQKQKGTFYF